MQSKQNPEKPAQPYVSKANPRVFASEGQVREPGDTQPQSGSGFRGQSARPAQDSDWYGVRRPDPSPVKRADPAHLDAAAARRKPTP